MQTVIIKILPKNILEGSMLNTIFLVLFSETINRSLLMNADE